MGSKESDLKSILTENEPTKSLIERKPQKQLRPSEWVEIRLFISSTFVDTHSERDLLIKKIIPELNHELKHKCITIVPVDLRWGVFGERSKDCYAIQKTCLNEIDNCRQNKKTYPYFIGLRTQRYGWVQNVLLEKDGYENPELFSWVDAIEEHRKQLSITSLECIHGSFPVEEIPQAPTVFFYEREITNPEDIEEEFLWIFDMEYQKEDMGPQYTLTDKAEMYADDKNKLNEYLQSLNNVKYSEYKCTYEQGGARITGSKGDKLFGIGKVKGLDELEKKMREDLYGAIEKNFMKADISSFSKLELSNMQYEEAIKEKALRFVGRPTHTEKIMEHCTAKNVESSVLIVAGKPGRGKSALMAYAAVVWWLPSEDSPNNLRVIVSTLLKENKTYDNASERCPNAHIVNVGDMTNEESKEMVSTILARYNKRLTTDDSDPFLKNQMELLIAKNTSPLYLSVACEALRTEGVFEKMTKFIENLPKTVPELFSSLLEGWSQDYGADFMKYLMCIVTLSRDGLLENVISHIVSYIANKTKDDFQCSVSTVFPSIRGFLSSGGGGYLHFFHDQVNMVVREKYLKPSPLFEAEVHDLLAGFYLQQIQPQLAQKPTSTPPLYYDDCLRHVVHHQIAARVKDEQNLDFSLTLQNIFYVREKIKAKQESILQKEYLSALRHTTDKTSLTALRNWRKFVSIYRPFIEEIPQWSYNMAVNQISSSYVYMDTKKLKVETEHNEKFPTYWTNKPAREQDHVLLKYKSEECWNCATTTVKGNMVAVNHREFMSLELYDMTTCELICQCHTKSITTFMTLSRDNHLFVGDSHGCVHMFDINSGKLVWSSEKIGEKKDEKRRRYVLWLQQCNDKYLCGTGGGTVAYLCTAARTITNTMKTGEETFVYHYHHTSELLYTGHRNSVKCWKLNGELVRSLEVKGEVKSLTVHPTKENVVACRIKESYREGIQLIQLNLLNGEVMLEVKGTSEGRPDVVYTHDGERLVYVDKDHKTLILLDSDGNITNKVKGHSLHINRIRLVPGTNQLLTAGEDGSYLFNLPTTPDQQHEDELEYEALSCAVVSNRNEIILLKKNEDDKYFVERCHGDTFVTLASAEVEGKDGWCMIVVAHPTNSNIVVVNAINDLLFLDTTTLETVAKHTLVSERKDDFIRDFNICKEGTKCVATKQESGVHVLDITNIDTVSTLARLYEKTRSRIWSSDINKDGSRVVCEGKGMVLCDVTTSRAIKLLRKEKSQFVRFVHQPDGVLFVDVKYKLHLMNLEGVVTHSFAEKVYHYSPTFLSTPYIVTGNQKDNTIEIHDITTQLTVFKFYHPSSEGFKRFVYQPEHNKLFAVNNNGKLYLLKDGER